MDDDQFVVRVRTAVRLDRFLTHKLAHVSRRRVQQHIERGDVLVNGVAVRPSHRLSGGEVVALKPFAARRLDVASQPVDLRVVYEDETLFVVDKPAGIVVHPVGNDYQRTVLNGLYLRMRAAGEDVSELGIVHRLDRLTSGLLVVTKRLEARRALTRQVEERSMKRVYVGVVAGCPATMQGVIDFYIRRDPARPTRMQALEAHEAAVALRHVPAAVSSSGYSDPRLDTRPRRARTRYTLLRRLRQACVLRFELDTGRTHQIRVHARAAGMPLLGDPLYGPSPPGGPPGADSIERPALHAWQLEFTHPMHNERRRFRAALPRDLRALIVHLSR